jgi:hypothetical protein
VASDLSNDREANNWAKLPKSNPDARCTPDGGESCKELLTEGLRLIRFKEKTLI